MECSPYWAHPSLFSTRLLATISPGLLSVVSPGLFFIVSPGPLSWFPQVFSAQFLQALSVCIHSFTRSSHYNIPRYSLSRFCGSSLYVFTRSSLYSPQVFVREFSKSTPFSLARSSL